jgi:hypothetical protein
MNYIPEIGDIFLCDSDRIGAKIVKELMRAPTIYQYIWRAIKGTQEEVRYYHAGMILGDQLIEQQSKVHLDNTDKILSRRVIIYRHRKKLPVRIFGGESFYTDSGKIEKIIPDTVKVRALDDLGNRYDILEVIGKMLTWLTGIKLFTVISGEFTKEHICVTAVAYWWWGFCQFGEKYHSLLTTKKMDEYCRNHPEEWEIIYQNEGE